MKKDKISILYLSISVIILVYVVYKSEFAWSGDRRSYYFTYYIASLFLMIFSVFSFFLNKKVRTYSLILIISIFFAFYSFETYQILGFKNISKFKIYKKNTGKKYDQRSLFEIYDDLKKKDKNIAMRVFPKLHIKNSSIDFFPLSGKSLSKTINCNENGYFSIFKSDRYGFNNLDKVWDQNNTEYFLIGDSFVQGCCVDRPNDFSSLLTMLSKKNVINVGYSGNGPLLEYASMKEYYPQNVKNILWFYYEGNDVKDLQREISNKFLKNYLNNNNFSQNLKQKQKRVDKEILSIIDFERNNSLLNRSYKKKIYQFIKLSNLRSMMNRFLPEKNRPPTQRSIGPEFKEIMKLAKEFSKTNGSDLYFVYLPTFKRYKMIDNNNKNYNKVKSVINDLNIPLIDIHELVFKKEINPLSLFPFQEEGHYNVEGYNKITNVVHKFVQNSKK